MAELDPASDDDYEQTIRALAAHPSGFPYDPADVVPFLLRRLDEERARVAQVDTLRNECWQGVAVHQAAEMHGPYVDAKTVAQRLDGALAARPVVRDMYQRSVDAD